MLQSSFINAVVVILFSGVGFIFGYQPDAAMAFVAWIVMCFIDLIIYLGKTPKF